MRVFKELRTNGYVFFGKTKLDLDYQGVTVIQAQNLDARKDKSSTNGAGKSLLMGLLPEVFYDSVPTGKDIKAQKMRRAGGVTLEVGGDTYDLDRTWGSKKDFTIAKNGEDTKVRTLQLAADRALKLIGLSEEEFYTTAYIDVNRVHPLIRGSSAQRLDYFTSMFRLHDVDNIRKLLLQELRDAQAAGTTYKELVAQFESLRGGTSASEVKAMRERLAVLDERAKRYIELSAKYSEVQEVIEFADTNANQISRVKAICKPKFIEETLVQKRKLLRNNRSELETAIEWAQERKLIKSLQRDYDKVLEKVKAKGYTTSPEKAEKGHRKYKEALEELEVLEREYARVEKDMDTYVKEITPLETSKIVKASRFEDLRDKITKAHVKLEQLRHEKQHVKQFEKGVCPSCGQSVKARPLSEITDEIQQQKSLIARYESALQYKELRAKIDALEEPYNVLPHDIKTLQDTVAKWKSYAKAHELLSDLKPVPKAKVEKPKRDRDVLEDNIRDLEAEIEILSKAADAVSMYIAASRINDDDRQLAKSLKQKMQKLESSSQEAIVLESKIEQEEQKLKNLRKVRDKALTLKERAADVPVIKALLEVYSNKMLKKLMVQRYASVIQDQLNKFRSIMFSEDFSFELIYDTKFHILCHRKYGKREVTSDVRKLSGAEGRGFALLLLLAILTLIPKSRRLNLLVLDEADSNMGPDMLKNFQRFIPILNKVIPHIIVVTPKPDVEYDNARYFTIVKQNGKSKLVKGRLAT